MSDQAQIRIETNELLTGVSGKGLCTVGAFAFDQAGQCFVLTAIDAFRGERTRAVFSSKRKKQIGMLDNLHNRGGGILPFWKAVGLVRLNAGVVPVVDRLSQNGYPVVALSIANLIDLNVQILGRPNLLGVVHATYGEISVESRFDRAVRTYDHAVEVDARLSKAKLRRGDAGSLVVANQRQAVGIMIGGTRRMWFVAPMLPLLESLSLSLIPPPTNEHCETFPNPITALATLDRASLSNEPKFDLGPIPTASNLPAMR